MIVKVTDKIMSAGKSYTKLMEITQSIKSNPDEKYIFLVLTRDEIKRVIEDTNGTLIRPTYGVNDSDENDESGILRDSFRALAREKRNIVTTHSLFLMLTVNDVPLLEGYNLVIDETPDVINIRKDSINDINEFYENGTIAVDESNRVAWNPLKKDYKGSLDELKKRIDKGTITAVISEDENKISALVWNYPQEIFRAFKSVEVLTYLFEDSLFRAYLRFHGFGYSMPVLFTEHGHIKRVRSLITIYHGSLNNIGDDYYSLSKNWFNRNNKNKNSKKEKNLIPQLKKNTINFFRKLETDTKEHAFAVFKDYVDDLAGKRYNKYKDRQNAKPEDKGWVYCDIPINARATNDFSNKKAIAYLVNRFYDKRLFSYFNQNNIEVTQDGLALSELLQLVFRGNIRNMFKVYKDETPVDSSMILYIPSSRMRNLLENYLNQSALDVRNYRNRR